MASSKNLSNRFEIVRLSKSRFDWLKLLHRLRRFVLVILGIVLQNHSDVTVTNRSNWFPWLNRSLNRFQKIFKSSPRLKYPKVKTDWLNAPEFPEIVQLFFDMHPRIPDFWTFLTYSSTFLHFRRSKTGFIFLLFHLILSFCSVSKGLQKPFIIPSRSSAFYATQKRELDIEKITKNQ